MPSLAHCCIGTLCAKNRHKAFGSACDLILHLDAACLHQFCCTTYSLGAVRLAHCSTACYLPAAVPGQKPGAVPVAFFGTYELAWLPASSVKGFKEGLANKAHLNNRKAVAAFRKGLSEVVDYFKVCAWCTGSA